MKEDEIAKYCSMMEEVKRRYESIDALIAGSAAILYPAIKIETVYLQFRKVLELIALSTLVANRAEYERLRAQFATDWHAERILATIRQINADYYPKPILEQAGSDPWITKKWISRQADYLTEDGFVKLYQDCGSILHAANPYQTAPDYSYFERQIVGRRGEIINLLDTHLIVLASDPNRYLVHMKEQNRGVTHYTFKRVDGGAAPFGGL